MVQGSPNSIEFFNNQRYDSLKKKCQRKGIPFSDPSFPADDSSLFYTAQQRRELPGKVEWKRPKDLCENPKLFGKGVSSSDVTQGMLDNCWFVASLSALAQEKELRNKVIPNPEEQDWDDKRPSSHAGIFHFRFWRFGTWIDVVVDDLLPTINGRLVFLRCKEKNEFWGPLIEKAYAKLSGKYAALNSGNLTDALVDFSGGIAEVLGLRDTSYAREEDERKNLFKTMTREMSNHSLMCAAIKANSRSEVETVTNFGLVKGHAYCVTNIKEIHIKGTGLAAFFTGRKKIYMVRLRNPWGKKEWNGPFSDSSREWNNISKAEKEKLGLTFGEDGEFWMPFEDFCRHFTDLSICYMVNTSWFSFSKTWSEAAITRSWTKGPKGSKEDRCGGCINHTESFLRNPQFCFNITSEKDTIMIFLSQKDIRAEKQEGTQCLVIGFHIMRAEENRQYRLHTVLKKAASSDYIKTRGIFLRCTLDRGRYVVIPSTFEPGKTGHFYLRIFTSYNAGARELIKDAPKPSLFPCVRPLCLVTKVTLLGATGLEKQGRFGTVDPFCIIKCEGEVIRSSVCPNTLTPTWNISVIFYRKNINSPVKVEVWDSNILRNSFIGRVVLKSEVNPKTFIHQANLLGKGRDKGTKKPGKLSVEISTRDDLASF